MISLVASLYLLSIVSCTKHFLYDVPVLGFPDGLTYESMYSLEDEKGPFEPTIEFKLAFKGPPNHKVYVVIGDRVNVNEKISCIDNSLIEITPVERGAELLVVTEVITSDVETVVERSYPVKGSNLYTAFIMSCEIENFDYDETEYVTVNGDISFRNPTGLLPAHRYPLIHAYVMFFLVDVVLFGYWYFQCVKKQTNLMTYHYVISASIICALLEAMIHVAFLITYNREGYRSHVLYLLAKYYLIARKLICRVMILLIANGVAINKKDASPVLKRATFVFCATYFSLDALFWLHRDFHVRSRVQAVEIAISLFLSLLDTFFYLWTFVALKETMNSLNENETYKKKLFKNFMLAMCFGLVCAFAFMLLQMNYIRDKEWLKISGWKVYWLYEMGFSELLYIFFTLAICYIMSPTADISEYQQVASMDLENNAQTFSDSEKEGKAKKKDIKDSFEDPEENDDEFSCTSVTTPLSDEEDELSSDVKTGQNEQKNDETGQKNNEIDRKDVENDPKNVENDQNDPKNAENGRNDPKNGEIESKAGEIDKTETKDTAADEKETKTESNGGALENGVAESFIDEAAPAESEKEAAPAESDEKKESAAADPIKTIDPPSAEESDVKDAPDRNSDEQSSESNEAAVGEESEIKREKDGKCD